MKEPRIDAVLMGVEMLVYTVLTVIGLWLNRASDQYKPLSGDEDAVELESPQSGKTLLVFLILI